MVPRLPFAPVVSSIRSFPMQSCDSILSPLRMSLLAVFCSPLLCPSPMPVSFRLAAAIPAAIRSSSCPALRPNSRSLAPGGTGASFSLRPFPFYQGRVFILTVLPQSRHRSALVVGAFFSFYLLRVITLPRPFAVRRKGAVSYRVLFQSSGIQHRLPPQERG